jgi:hypothetical protein
MSPSDGKKKRTYEPAPETSGRLTPAEFQDLGNFFYKLSESKSAQTLAVLAAIGAILEGLHIIWLALLWMGGRWLH